MSDIQSLPKGLPSMEHEFSIDLEGNTTKAKYTGNFKSRILTNRLKAAAAKKAAELNGGMEKSLDPSIIQFHYMVSYLRAALADAPDWWKKSDYGYDLYDANVVDAVYARVMEFEVDWMKQVWGDNGAGEEKAG